ncbi:MAG TPA: hypothetical protein VMZ28_04785 [Kofleriaceae bacterium]|nr:hypothetical protein [Kofleriaceae bacterium]
MARRHAFSAFLVLASTSVTSARADEGGGDAYCDWVEGVAASESALMFGPTLFGSLGSVDQGVIVTVPDASGRDTRLTAGVNVRLTGILEGIATRSQARANCERHLALTRFEGATVHAALTAKAAVLDEALEEADKLVREAAEDLRERRATAQDVTATRIRVQALRASASATHAELAALPAAKPSKGEGDGGVAALRDYFQADEDMGRQEARLRRLQAVDLSVRFGYDAFTGPLDDDESPYFGVIAASFNLGMLFQGSAEQRAAEGRRRFVRAERGGNTEPTLRHLRVQASEARQREAETAVLVKDLEKQLASLDEVGGETGRRYRDLIWFELVNARAEHAYLRAQADGLAGLVREQGGE